jgi:flavorubredoxin
MFKKILLSIVAVILLIIVSAISTIIIFKNGVDSKRPSQETIMKSEKNNGKEALVIFQNSRSEFPKEIAVSFATGLNNKGFNVTVNTAGDFLPKDVSKYDVVILGGAVVAGNLGTPLQEYAKDIQNFGNAKVFLYSTGAGLDNLDELNNLQELLSKKPEQKVKFLYSDKENSKDKAISLGEEFGSK